MQTENLYLWDSMGRVRAGQGQGRPFLSQEGRILGGGSHGNRRRFSREAWVGQGSAWVGLPVGVTRVPVVLGTGHTSLYLIPGLDLSSRWPWLPALSAPPSPRERECFRGLFIANAFWRQDGLGSLVGLATMTSDLWDHLFYRMRLDKSTIGFLP